ncbi:MAG: hypothetical protein OEQ39_02920 [Gammaproteobacteria bacterium]|nr:hypothetical protein [Gammaproteobacteria bacterium]
MRTEEQATYAIVTTQYYYGPRTTKQRLLDDQGMEWVGSRAAARKLIDDLDAAIYWHSYNECSRPKYTIVKAG